MLGMSNRDLSKLVSLSREQLLRKLQELDDARRVIVALIRSRPNGKRKAVARAR